MKKLHLVFLSMLVAAFSHSQTYRLTWGEEVKLKKGTADLDIIAVDNTGLYFAESRIKMKGYFIVAASYGESQKLVKLDKNYGEVFEKEYKKELKGLAFHSFQNMGENLYMFATDYDRKSKTFKVMGSKIDKSTGDLSGDFMELGSYQLESKRDDFEISVNTIEDGKAFLLVSNISGDDKVSLGVHVLDKMLKRKESAVINLNFKPDNYTLQGVTVNKKNKIILLGKEFEETQIGRKKRKRMVFKQYVMSIYDFNGKKEKDVKIDSDDRYIISGKLIEKPDGEVLLAGFFSNNAKKDDIHGFYINKVDPDNGTLVVSSYKEINTSMLGKGVIDDSEDDDESKREKKEAKKAKEDDEEDEFPNSFTIKSVIFNPADESIIITSEVSAYSYYALRSYNASTKTWSTTHVHRFTNKDVLVINADKNGNIKWLNAIPKYQIEEVRTSNGGGGWSYYDAAGGLFARAGGMPYYSSFTSILHGNSLVLIMNDHTSNNVNAEYGDKVKAVANFRKKSNVYGISIDLATGKMTRKVIGSNREDAILMPRHAYVIKNELVMPSWRQHMLAKTDLKFARIQVK
jgi:hypothetical protein